MSGRSELVGLVSTSLNYEAGALTGELSTFFASPLPPPLRGRWVFKNKKLPK